VKLDWLGEDDVDSALALSAAEGWNQTSADWRRLVQLEPSGCFAARAGDRLVGTVTTTTYGRDLAWIGMMVIDPDFRGRGIGTDLMRMALDYLNSLGITNIKLDATPAGRPLYESLGFVAEAELERWQGVARPPSGVLPSEPSGDVLPALVVLDEAAYGADRSALLELLVSEALGAPLLVRSDAESPGGYALARRGRVATYIGPIVATTAEAAGQLISQMLAQLAGTDVCFDLHLGGMLDTGALAEGGLSKRRSLTRMRRGATNSGGTWRLICASAGPEFG
jgi:GNAT superfamily N-acetyltransferase